MRHKEQHVDSILAVICKWAGMDRASLAIVSKIYFCLLMDILICFMYLSGGLHRQTIILASCLLLAVMLASSKTRGAAVIMAVICVFSCLLLYSPLIHYYNLPVFIMMSVTVLLVPVAAFLLGQSTKKVLVLVAALQALIILCLAGICAHLHLVEYPKAGTFLNEIEQIDFHIWSEAPEGFSVFTLTHDELKAIFPENVKLGPLGGAILKFIYPGEAHMRDGTRREMRFYGGSGIEFTVEGLNVLFRFDDTGINKWAKISQRRRDFLEQLEKEREKNIEKPGQAR